ncbi:MAG: SRPBCC family protein [Solirubrobacterales bacterium]|nr:SRPBCC family protein [Solirubrobacterales bacterium]
MKLDQSFEVAAPIERVWKALIDVEHVAPCLPGAQITGRNDDDSYAGSFTVKIGPTTASYAGRLEMEQVDEDGHTATMQAQGNDKRGQGGAKATIVSKLSETPQGKTHVDVTTDYHITGRLARFGRGGMIEDISERLLREFAGRLQASLEGDGASGSPSPPAATEAPATTEGTPGAPVTTEGAAETSATAATETPPAPEMPPAPPPPSEPIQGVSLMGSVLWQRARKNPAPIAILAALVLAFLLGRRTGR